ncbi:MAG: homoserine O-succinyltransferase [Candidatus Paceibacterota bacterium]
MPVKIPDDLPAVKVLEEENIFVMPESRAFTQDIRPLQIAIVNIMPKKSVTETQLLRLLSNSPLQAAVTFLHPRSHTSKNTAPEHLAKFYKNFEDVKEAKFDCLIITGAPVETIDFSAVAYWNELQEIMEWSRSHVYSSLHICWGAQAGLYHHYGIPKYATSQKIFGIFPHKIIEQHNSLLCGFDDVFLAPHSRHTEVRREDILKISSLRILSESDTAGVFIVSIKDDRQIFITGHPEYDQMTLKDEYERDISKGLPTSLPVNYFPDNDHYKIPMVNWRSHASLLFANWLNIVYQKTPFDLNNLEPLV